jgi:hypothetical protein
MDGVRLRSVAVAITWMSVMTAGAALAGSRADGHAPIGVMGDHTHNAGEVMFSYRYMRMRMDGNRNDTDSISTSKVLQSYPIAPTDMDMQMHMFSAMYAPIDLMTLILMVPYVELDMHHKVRPGLMGMYANGGSFTTRSQGIGDVSAGALIRVLEEAHHHVHAQIAFSFPTGSITNQDMTPMSGGSTVRLPYPMQLGSGSYDFLPALTYTGDHGMWSWGTQANADIPMNDNHASYRKGDEYAFTAWGGIELAPWMSTSLRALWQQAVNYHGRDESPSINPAMVPTADPGKRAAMRLDLLLGVNLLVPSGPLKGFRVAIEAGLPTYQNLDGPQLETEWTLTTGVQYAF